MSTLRIVFLFACSAIGASSLSAQFQLPRKAPEFTITKPSGEQMLLSSFKGKVVVMEFMFIGSPKCIRLAQMLDALERDLGSRGYQSVAIAFGPHVDQALVGHVADHLALPYPLGFTTTSSEVDAFLGREGSEKLKIPQMVVIDRKGVIRAATGDGADTRMEDEAALRTLVSSLLDETGSPSATNAKTQRLHEKSCILFTACAQFAAGSSAAAGVETSALTPVLFCALLLDDRRLFPLGAPIPQNAAVPSLAPRRPARPCPAVFLICWLSLLHADARQGLILFPFAHSRSKPTRSAPRAVFHSYPRG
jgi:peroxiredoxin